MTELSQIVRQRLVELMVQIVARTIGPEFDFVLVVRTGSKPSYVLTDVPPEGRDRTAGRSADRVDASLSGAIGAHYRPGCGWWSKRRHRSSDRPMAIRAPRPTIFY